MVRQRGGSQTGALGQRGQVGSGGAPQGRAGRLVGRRHRVCRADTAGRLPAAGVGRWVSEAGSGRGGLCGEGMRWAEGRGLAGGAAAGAGEGPCRVGLLRGEALPPGGGSGRGGPRGRPSPLPTPDLSLPLRLGGGAPHAAPDQPARAARAAASTEASHQRPPLPLHETGPGI